MKLLKSGNPDLNRGPLRPERSALPAALLPEKKQQVNLLSIEKPAHCERAFDGSEGARTLDLRRDRPAR